MLLNFLNHLQKQYYRSENGQDLAEYSLLIGLIALLVVVSLTIIGGSISTIFNAIAVALQIGV
jgi:Flp pilus assembly pilin Flp